MDLTMRIKRITNMIEIARLHAHVRHGMLDAPEIGILIKDDVIVWGKMPEKVEDDSEFVRELVERAKKESTRI